MTTLERQRERGTRTAKWVSGLASCVCAVGFVFWALHQPLPNPAATPATIAATALMMGACALATLGMCERWALLLRRVDPDLPRAEAYRSAALGVIGNACLPVRAGDAIRVGLVATASEKLNARTSIGTLVAERALDIGCHVCLLTAVLLARFGPSAGGPLGRLATIAAGLGLLAVAAAIAARLGGFALSRWPPRGRLWDFLAPVFGPLAGLRTGSAGLVALSAGIWLTEILAWWAAAQAVGLEIGLPQAAYVFAIATLALIAPIGFGAIGTLEAAIVFSVDSLGVDTAAVLGFVLLLRVAFVLPSAIVAAGLGLAQRSGYRPGRVAASEAVSP